MRGGGGRAGQGAVGGLGGGAAQAAGDGVGGGQPGCGGHVNVVPIKQDRRLCRWGEGGRQQGRGWGEPIVQIPAQQQTTGGSPGAPSVLLPGTLDTSNPPGPAPPPPPHTLELGAAGEVGGRKACTGQSPVCEGRGGSGHHACSDATPTCAWAVPLPPPLPQTILEQLKGLYQKSHTAITPRTLGGLEDTKRNARGTRTDVRWGGLQGRDAAWDSVGPAPAAGSPKLARLAEDRSATPAQRINKGAGDVM